MSIGPESFANSCPITTMTLSGPARLAQLRSLLATQRLSALIVLSSDAHQSEYVASCDRRREFISGFSGSAGTALITNEQAFLWTDGRYFLQAEQELFPGWQLKRAGEDETIEECLKRKDVIPSGSRVGVDAWTVGIRTVKTWQNTLKSRCDNTTLVCSPDEGNLVDQVWGLSRPAPPSAAVRVLSTQYSGQHHDSKLRRVREQLRKEGADGMIVTALDEIAWLLNLRGADVDYNPVILSYCVLTREECMLYVDPAKIDAQVRLQHLKPNVEIASYSNLLTDLRERWRPLGLRWLIDPGQVNYAIYSTMTDVDVAESPSQRTKVLEDTSPITLMKAIKNDTEVTGFRNSHIRDGAALVKYLHWLENTVKTETVTEVSGAQKLLEFRKEQKHFVSESFETISGSGPNGAIIHYKPEEERCRAISANEMYLVDSGGQYLDGTTDVTRTVHFGTPTPHQKRCFTRVLQGFIALGSACFPEGTSGYKLDLLARMPLWKEGLDYKHGTGHGVGHFLNVHEGPHGISFRSQCDDVDLRPGMTVTNEPGYYEDNAFGIRIENVLVCSEADTPNRFGSKRYLCFEQLTYCPIQTSLIDTALLSAPEAEWLNNYHARCLEVLSPLLHDSPTALDWLRDQCQPIHLT